MHKVSLYADDLLLYVTNPAMSLPSILSRLEEFGKLVGYKVNMQKSEVFPLNPTALNIPASAFPFKRVTSHFKYLGISVPRSFQLLYKLNFSPLIDKCKQDLERWRTLPLSLAGRINLIKINIIPKFIYLFQNIPVFPKRSFVFSIEHFLISSGMAGSPGLGRPFYKDPKHREGCPCPTSFIITGLVTSIKSLHMSKAIFLSMHLNG